MPEFDVHTTELIAGGNALGRLPDGRAVFVVGGAPEERVRVVLIKETKQWAKAAIVKILKPSPDRVTAPYAQELLGGATWSHIGYQAQFMAKEQVLRNTLERIGGISSVLIDPIVASPAEWQYRNRVEYTFGMHEGRLRLGTLLPGSDTDIVPARGTALFGEPATVILKRLLAWSAAVPRTVWSPRGGRDGIRSVILRRGIHTNDLVVHLVATSGIPIDHSLPSYFDGLPVTGVVWSTNDAPKHVTRFDTTTVLAGQRLLTEKVGELALSYDVTSFFQANVEAAELLLTTLQEHFTHSKQIVDLYAGVGLLGLGTAKTTIPLTLVESHAQSVQDAKANANDRRAETTIINATADTYLTREHVSSEAMVIVDPPRTGLERRVIESLLRDAPASIAYVSCDPATLARDLKLFTTQYKPTFIQPFDFFPQTPHIETAAILQRI